MSVQHGVYKQDTTWTQRRRFGFAKPEFSPTVLFNADFCNRVSKRVADSEFDYTNAIV